MKEEDKGNRLGPDQNPSSRNQKIGARSNTVLYYFGKVQKVRDEGFKRLSTIKATLYIVYPCKTW